MFSIIKNTAFQLKERFKTMPFIYILIFSFSLLVFFYEDIPQAFIPTLMLSGAICFFLSDCALSLKRIKKVILAIITFAFMSGVLYIPYHSKQSNRKIFIFSNISLLFFFYKFIFSIQKTLLFTNEGKNCAHTNFFCPFYCHLYVFIF